MARSGSVTRLNQEQRAVVNTLSIETNPFLRIDNIGTEVGIAQLGTRTLALIRKIHFVRDDRVLEVEAERIGVFRDEGVSQFGPFIRIAELSGPMARYIPLLPGYSVDDHFTRAQRELLTLRFMEEVAGHITKSPDEWKMTKSGVQLDARNFK